MKANVQVNAGICGLCTKVAACCPDGQSVQFAITTDCEKVRKLAELLESRGPVDAYHEAGAGSDGVILTSARETLKGCCAACAVSICIFKSMQVAAGLALPKDITIEMNKEC